MTFVPALARNRCAGIVALALVGLASMGHAQCVRSCSGTLTACKRTRCAGVRGAERRRCLDDCRGSSGCGGGIGTFAYVVSTCRVQAGGMQLGAQELRIRRNGCDPVTVMRFANPEPVLDPAGLCTYASKNHSGNLSPMAGVFQRLGVSADGGSVVFEVTNQHQLLFPPLDLAPEQQGFFWVRADGTGLRRLGPPSRDPVYRVTTAPVAGGGFVYTAGVASKLAVSDDGTRIAYSDVGPGASGAETQQVVTLDVATGERRQVTHFEPASPSQYTPHPLLGLVFLNADLIGFERPTLEKWEAWVIDFAGSNLRDWEAIDSGPTVPGGGGRITPRLGLTTRGFNVFKRGVDGPAENSDVFPGYGALDLFRNTGANVVQLTNFHRVDTELVRSRPSGVVFMASGDRVGKNPDQNCQLFRVSLLGTGLRQLTRFGTGERSREGCKNFGETPGCGIDVLAVDWFKLKSRSLLFYSDCDPFGTNPDGSQMFAIDFDGSHLRQLTHTAGAHPADDGMLEVEIPGPTATGGR